MHIMSFAKDPVITVSCSQAIWACCHYFGQKIGNGIAPLWSPVRGLHRSLYLKCIAPKGRRAGVSSVWLDSSNLVEVHQVVTSPITSFQTLNLYRSYTITMNEWMNVAVILPRHNFSGFAGRCESCKTYWMVVPFASLFTSICIALPSFSFVRS